MEIEKLISARIDVWDSDGLYEEKFRLQLTAKHALAVGKWKIDNEWGVDLRRWSYDKARLLGQGITLDQEMWQWLYDAICTLNDKDVFVNYGKFRKQDYEKTKNLGRGFCLSTGLFDESNTPYFCINMIKNNELIWRGRGTFVGIIIRFNMIPNFINQVQINELGQKRAILSDKKRIDPMTGREIY